MFNHVLVLPEYIVDFTYQLEPASPLAPAAPAAALGGGGGGGSCVVMAADLQASSAGAAGQGPPNATHQAILDSLDADIRYAPIRGWGVC